jgi:beta-lactamase regulating signal transducer with metallopeptidase domain
VSLSTLADLVGAIAPTQILAVLFEASLKGSVLLLLAWIAVRVLRHASAALRHLIWASALGGMLLLPILTGVVPRLGVSGLPSLGSVRETPLPTARAPRVDQPHVVRVEPASADVAPMPVPRSMSAEPSSRVFEWSAVTRYAPLAWIIVTTLVLLRLFVGTLRLSSWSRRASPVDDGAWLSLAQRLASRLQIARPVTLLRSERACVPMTWGVVYPTVLLPIDADEWSNERRTIVLLHELAHVKRFDAFTQLVAQLAVGIFWFNPLVWVAARQMRTEREHACDDCVLEGGARATDYAYDLLQIARSLGGSSAPSSAALAMARHSEFEGRLLAILDPKTRRQSVSRARLALSAAAVILLSLPLAALTSAAPTPQPAAEAHLAPLAPLAPLEPLAPLPQVPPAPPQVPRMASAPVLPPVVQPELPAHIRGLSSAPMVAATPTLSSAAQRLIDRFTPAALPALFKQNAAPDRETLIAVVKQAAKMTSDFEKAELLITVAKYYIRDDELRTAYLDAVATMASSYEQSRTLLPLLLKDDLPAHATAQVVKIASLMSSDNDKATLLVKTITDHTSLTAGVRDAIIAATGTIGSGYDRGRTIAAILKRGGLSNGQLIDIIGLTKGMSSSTEQANVLIDVSNRHSLEDKSVRDAFMRAAETISSAYEYRRVMSAVLK